MELLSKAHCLSLPIALNPLTLYLKVCDTKANREELLYVNNIVNTVDVH